MDYQCRVRVVWDKQSPVYNGEADIDTIVKSHEVQTFLAPVKKGSIFLGNSYGGVLDRHGEGMGLYRVATIDVKDIPT